MRGVIQIGAHLAEEYETWLAMGVKNFIFFEPIDDNYNFIVNKLPKTASIYKLALGNMVGQVEMFTDQNKMSSSVLEPLTHLEQYPDIKFEDRECVEINKLDNIEYDRRLFDHLHIDGQGYELEILKGATASLRFINSITTEVYRKELYRGCPMIDEITNYLYAEGFELMSVSWRGESWGDAEYSRG